MKILILVFAAIFLLASSPFAREDLVKEEKRLEKVKERIKAEKTKARKFSRKETTILGELQRINKRIVKERKELGKVEGSLGRIQKKITGATTAIRGLEAERVVLLRRLKARMRAMYMMRNGAALNVLFSTDLQDSRTFGRRHKYLSIIMDSDAGLIRGTEENLERLGDERFRLKALRSDMEAARSTAIRHKEGAERLRRSRMALLRGVQRQKKRSLDVARELAHAASELTALVERLRSEGRGPGGRRGFASMKGRLLRPVDGRVVSFYGKVRHPRFKTVTFNNGIIIKAPAGRPVKSVYSGKVIYTGWLKGYGQLMILDNGSGFYTLFAYLDKVLKGRGETVEKGTEIALVGETGMGASSGLYFEIRERGVSTDPLRWLVSR
jgi:septal ring factor EnvC (AmiA/AmiB activator)